jgi:hypothetical protein
LGLLLQAKEDWKKRTKDRDLGQPRARAHNMKEKSMLCLLASSQYPRFAIQLVREKNKNKLL